MARGRSTEIISMIKWIRTSSLSIQNSLSIQVRTPNPELKNVTWRSPVRQVVRKVPLNTRTQKLYLSLKFITLEY